MGHTQNAEVEICNFGELFLSSELPLRLLRVWLAGLVALFCGALFELYTVPVLISTYAFTPRFAASLPTVTLNW